MKKQKIYIALIGDLVSSRQLEDREQVQKQLKDALKWLNTMYAKDLASKFTITLGDEFQGLLKDGTHCMDMIFYLEQALFPVRFRMGIGIGTMWTPIQPEISLGADGPAYHNAREAIELLKANKNRVHSFSQDAMIMGMEEIPFDYRMTNEVLALLLVIKQSWTSRQRLVIHRMYRASKSQEELAKELGVQQPAIQKNLASGHFYLFQDTMELLGHKFSEVTQHAL